MTNSILDSGQKIVTDGLVLNYDVAQLQSYPTTGTVLTDLSGNNNNGTLVNGVGFNSGNGGSLVFDGVNDYVNSGNNSSLNFERTDSFSLSAWVNVNSLTGVVINKTDSDGKGWISGLNANGSINFILRNTLSTNDFFVSTSASSILINNWYNISINYIGNSSATGVFFYINGVKTTSDVVIRNSLTSNVSNNGIVSIGARVTNNVVYYNGNISQIQIYNKVLSSAEVLQNFNANRSRYVL